MHRVGRTRRNQPHIHHRARRPCVALVDGITMGVDLQRAVEVRALFDRTLATILNHAAPEEGLALVVSGFQFEPRVISVDSPAGETVSNLLRSPAYTYAASVAASQCWLHTVQRSRDRRSLSASA